MAGPIYTAPPGTGTSVRGVTLTEALYDACERFDNPAALNQPVDGGWQPFSLHAFRQQAEETALGLRALGLERGGRVGLFMESDVYFCIADMGCLLAGLVDVPIYLTHEPEALRYVLEHSGAEAVVVSDDELLKGIVEVLPETPEVRFVIQAQGEGAVEMPEGVEHLTLEAIRERGRAAMDEQPDAIERLRAVVEPSDLATIIYTSGTTGRPKGVMLTHENISFNGLTSFSGLGDAYRAGPEGETAISFLPLTHIFARALHYAYLAHGTSVYFTTPDDLAEAMKDVQPTYFASVPRVLEKVYASILGKATTLSGVKRLLLVWAISLARRYELGQEPQGLYALQLSIAEKLVFSKWREALGGRIRYLIVGGAALSPEIANVFAAAGIVSLQGYGLTETSPVIAFNRPGRNRAGTVGEPLPDVEVRIAEDGEILTRGPHVMQGYYRDEEKTAKVMEPGGWFHTGDVGEFTDDGFLRITDRKKDLFKLSTGKYVMPQPLENQLSAHPLIEQAVVIGSNRRFCAALIFPNEDALRTYAANHGLDPETSIDALLARNRIRHVYQRLVDRANRGMDPWSTIKRFALVPARLTVDNGMLTPTMKVKRRVIDERFADEIDALYEEAGRERRSTHLVEV